MSEVFIIQNQDKLFLSKQRAWVDGREPAGLYRTVHRDEAVNEKFEVNAKDYSQRVSLVTCPLNERGVPVLDPDIMPPPLPKAKRGDSLALDLAVPAQSPESSSADPASDTTAQGSSDDELGADADPSTARVG